jgi:hypothetical protein
MTGLWKPWKAKSRLDFHIPTAPTTRLMGKCKTKTRFPTFPQPRILSYGEGEKQGAAADFALAGTSIESNYR